MGGFLFDEYAEMTRQADDILGYSIKGLCLEDGLRLVRKRGQLMSSAPKGAMAAILGISKNEVVARLQDINLDSIDIANYNSPTQIVISGLVEDLKTARDAFDKSGARFIP